MIIKKSNGYKENYYKDDYKTIAKNNKEREKGIVYYMNKCEGGSIQLDPHHYKDNINTPAYQTENSNF